MKKLVLVAMIATTVISSCDNEENSNKMNIVKNGVEVAAGAGKAWTTIESTWDEKPLKVSITLTSAAVPEVHVMETKHEEPGASVYELPLPDNRSTTVFDHVTVDWNPHGHPPQNVYSFAHFDFHFYMVPKSERDKIPAFETDPSGFQKYPAADYLPTNYIPIPGGQAKMGVHWADKTSPELNPGGTFTQTFIYGSYNNRVNFYEPMVARDFLIGLTTVFERTIPQPAKVDRSGYYPTKMSLKKTHGNYEISLYGFVYRQATVQ